MGDTTVFPGNLTLDPLPHDSSYFADHLSFLRNYYETISKGKVYFADTIPVFPSGAMAAYRLNEPMWHYNHNTSEQDLNRTLVALFVDAVDSAYQRDRLDFSRFDAVIIFHAGTGKDFNLGYDATPFDIPSAYINDRDIPGGSVWGVTRGLILPEGENQKEALDLGIELSMNGIMVKLFGNWLGLPDLFDTQTGQSGIGRWGMMDQGSGNVNALVPAMPDAWSRVYMGWEHPLEVVPSGLGDTVHVARFGDPDTVQVIKLPITPREYFLIENRAADNDSGYSAIPDTGAFVELLDRDNHRLQVYRDGRMAVEPGFRVAVRVRDNRFDYGIPGSGILIWHVDTLVISQGLETNTVNINRDHRGVDLVEADGAQDIGMEYGFASAGSGTELGVPEDAWYKDNQPHRQANQNAPVHFADESFPSDRFYDGSFPHLELSRFSDVAPVMDFVVRSTKVAPGYPVAFPHPAEWAIADVNGDGRPEAYFLTSDSLYRVDSLGSVSFIDFVPPGMHLAHFNPPVDLDGDGKDEILLDGNRVGIVRNLNGTDTLQVSLQPLELSDNRAYPARGDSLGTGRILVVAADTAQSPQFFYASVYDLNLNRVVAQVRVAQGSRLAPLPYNVEPFPARRFVFVASGIASCWSVADSAIEWRWDRHDASIQPQAVIVAEPETTSVYLKGYGYVNAADGSVLCLEPRCGAPDVDWNGDGIPDGGGRFTRSNLQPEDAPRIATDTSWVMDVDCSGDPDLIGLAGTEGAYDRVLAASHSGGVFSGFPMALTVSDVRKPFVWTRDQALHLVSTTFANGRYYYSVVKLADTRGSERFRYTNDNAIINVGPLHPQVNSRAEWVYCWPNPTSDVSRIRITVPYAAQAEVRIFDLAGRKIAVLHGQSSAPGPLAFELPWDVSRVESGVYIGRVIVHGNGGSQESQLKIAVVK